MKVNKKFIIIVLIIVAVIVGLIFFINWQSKKPIRIAKEFINASIENNTETLDKLFDAKGFAAWFECDEDPDEFKEKYDSIDDDKVEKIVKDYFGNKEAYTILWDQIDYTNYVSDGTAEFSIVGEPEMEKIAPNMYEVKAKLKIKEDGETYTEKLEFIVYKNKIISVEY